MREFVKLNVWPRYGRKEPKTKDQGKWAINNFILPAIGDIACRELHLYHCEGILDRVRTGGVWNEKLEAWEEGTPRTGWTVNTVRKHLARITRLMARQRLIPYNYVEEIGLDDTESEEAVLTCQEIFSLWAENIDAPIGPAIFLTGMIGMRRGEALGRTVDDVGRTILVRTQRVREDKAVKDKAKLKTDNAPREIPIPELHRLTLDRYADGRRHLCTTSRGPMAPTSPRKMLLAALNRSGLPPCSLQSFRATFMSTMDELGCPRGILKAIVGHGSETVTDGYVSVLGEHPIRTWLGKYLEHASTLGPPEGGGTDASLIAAQIETQGSGN